jgi:hypothetical protein
MKLYIATGLILSRSVDIENMKKKVKVHNGIKPIGKLQSKKKVYELKGISRHESKSKRRPDITR